MSIQSMTGFGRGEKSDDTLSLTVEIKSVNHRYRDIRFRMSSLFNSIELELKNKLNSHFKRGSFDISINYKRSEDNSKFDDIDEQKVQKFLTKIKNSVGSDIEFKIQPTEFLRQEFYKEHDEKKEEKMRALAKEAFSVAMDELKKSRASEGGKLHDVLKDHRQSYEKHFLEIERRAGEFQANVDEKLRKRFKEYSSEIEVDESRFLQEVVYHLEKIDVHEEINRIHAHLNKLDELLGSKSEIGRQIDFLIQELNRETNTIGSKSSLKEVSDHVVLMKVQLEKMREQGLNLE